MDNKYTTSKSYPMNDLGSVYAHYNPNTGKNEPTPNVLPKNSKEDDNNGTGTN